MKNFFDFFSHDTDPEHLEEILQSQYGITFEKEETDKTGVFSNKTLAEAAELKLRMAPRTAMFTPSRTEDASGARGGI